MHASHDLLTDLKHIKPNSWSCRVALCRALLANWGGMALPSRTSPRTCSSEVMGCFYLFSLWAILLQHVRCIHPSAQLQTHAQQGGCTHEYLSTELLNCGSKGLEELRDVRERDLDICYMNSFSSSFASAKKCINLFSCLIKNILSGWTSHFLNITFICNRNV